MIMPTKIIKPTDSIFYISSRILKLIINSEKSIEDIILNIQDSHHKEIADEQVLLCLNFLYIIKKLSQKMKLLKLSSSNPKFNTLEFKDGMNIISGLQLSQEEKKTINGIGKSLSLKLVHYMFGSTFKSSGEKKLENFLKEYGTFYLDFEHKEKQYCISKNFNEPFYLINSKKVAKTNYLKELKKIFLNESSKISFRQMLNVFARRQNYYKDPLSQQGRPQEDYNQKFVNLYLLGIDTDTVEKKFNLNKQYENLEKVQGTLKEQEYNDPSDTKDTEDEMKRLQEKKDNFIIAENYNDLKAQSDRLDRELTTLRNEIYNKENSLKNKMEKLEQSKHADIDIREVEAIYHEAKFFFKNNIIKRMEDAQSFHKNLIYSRKKALKESISMLKSEINYLKGERSNMETKRDQKLKELGKQGALEEYNSLSDQIRILEVKLSKTREYYNMQDKLKEDLVNLDYEKAKTKKEGLGYLKKIKSHRNYINETFRNLVKRFYDNKGGALDIKETKDAKYLFDVEVTIPKDESQGINEVKIFCYDVLLFILNKDKLGFLAHDGCLFSEMDHRQKTKIFKIIIEQINKNNLQYFVNIGQNSLNEILDRGGKIGILTEEEKSYIEDSQILKLSDKNPENWLFGEEFT